MKKLVFQINVPSTTNLEKLKAYSYYQEMYEVSIKNAKKYAKKYNADYYMITKRDDFLPAKDKHLDFQKLKMYDFKKYDQILYLDCDYIIKDNAPNIFEICGDSVGVCLDAGKSVYKLADNLGIPQDKYFNAGFMHIPKSVLKNTKEILINHYLKYEYQFDGQGLLNKMFFDLGIKIKYLNPGDWNNTAKSFGKYGDHYAGRKKTRWNPNLY